MATGIELIAEERQRQIEKEGWTAEHDAGHKVYEFVLAGISYAEAANADAFMRETDKDFGSIFAKRTRGLEHWPWEPESFKPTTAKRDLVKAGALIAAAIDRLQMETEKKK